MRSSSSSSVMRCGRSFGCALGLLGLLGCGEGATGARGAFTPAPPAGSPDAVNANAVATVGVSSAMPVIASCGTTYTYAVEPNEEPVACERYSFVRLYRAAVQQTDLRFASIRCPGACPRPAPYVVAQHGRCDGARAQASLTTSFTCLEDGAAAIDGLPLRTEGELTGPFNERIPAPVAPTGEYLALELRPNRLAAACPYDFKYWTRYRERVPSCSGVIVAPFVDAAARVVRDLAVATPCAPGCAAQPVMEVGARWSCQDAVVTVDYQAVVPCR